VTRSLRGGLSLFSAGHHQDTTDLDEVGLSEAASIGGRATGYELERMAIAHAKFGGRMIPIRDL